VTRQRPLGPSETSGGSLAPPLDEKVELIYGSTMPSSGNDRVEFLPGTLDLIVLRTLSSMGPQHAYGIAARIEQLSTGPVRLNQGSLYPALVRLEQKGLIKGVWRTTENNRDARYYAITPAGGRELSAQVDRWKRSTALVNRLLSSEGR
jgi:PadR family transcriptional regulator, regulatory protein PadR